MQIPGYYACWFWTEEGTGKGREGEKIFLIILQLWIQMRGNEARRKTLKPFYWIAIWLFRFSYEFFL